MNRRNPKSLNYDPRWRAIDARSSKVPLQDEWAERYRQYFLDRNSSEDEVCALAEQLYVDDEASAKLEALILARCDEETEAKLAGVPVEVIRAYKRIFFDVENYDTSASFRRAYLVKDAKPGLDKTYKKFAFELGLPWLLWFMKDERYEQLPTDEIEKQLDKLMTSMGFRAMSLADAPADSRKFQAMLGIIKELTKLYEARRKQKSNQDTLLDKIKDLVVKDLVGGSDEIKQSPMQE